MQEKKIIKVGLVLGDIIVTQIALFLALFFRNKDLLGQFNNFSYNFAILYALWILIIFLLNLYNVYFLKKPIDFFLNVIIFSLFASFFSVAYFYFRPDFGPTPKTILILNIILFDMLFCVWRGSINALLKTRGLKEKIVMVGFGEHVKEIASQIQKNYDVVGFFLPAVIIKSRLSGYFF